jgi:hypothetical protein
MHRDAINGSPLAAKEGQSVLYLVGHAPAALCDGAFLASRCFSACLSFVFLDDSNPSNPKLSPPALAAVLREVHRYRNLNRIKNPAYCLLSTPFTASSACQTSLGGHRFLQGL